MDKWKFTKKINKSGVDGFRKIGIPRRRWRLFRFKDCSRKRSLNVRQARRMVQDRSEWRRFLRGEGMHGA